MMEWEPGPPPALQAIFEQVPLNEYMAAENRILKAQIKGRLVLSDT